MKTGPSPDAVSRSIFYIEPARLRVFVRLDVFANDGGDATQRISPGNDHSPGESRIGRDARIIDLFVGEALTAKVIRYGVRIRVYA